MAASDLAGALARTLQSLRAERGWSLDQLATRSGVSKGVLVALEQARSNPNLATLARISDAFGVPVTYLVDVPAERQRAGDRAGPGADPVARDRPAGRGPSSPRPRHPGRPSCGAGRSCPARSFGGDAARPGDREMVWVQEGTLTLTVAGTRHQVGPGRVRTLPGQPAARVRQRRHGARAADHDRRRPAGPVLTELAAARLPAPGPLPRILRVTAR